MGDRIKPDTYGCLCESSGILYSAFVNCQDPLIKGVFDVFWEQFNQFPSVSWCFLKKVGPVTKASKWFRNYPHGYCKNFFLLFNEVAYTF